MTRLSYKTLITILVIILIGIVVLVRIQQKPTTVLADWWNDSWTYRQAINISTHSIGETNVYITTTVNIGTTTKAQADDGDFRFTTTSGQLLDYYISSGTGSTAPTFHVQIDSYPAGPQTIYAYYGNPSASNGFSAADFATAASNSTIGSYSTEEVGGGPVAWWKFDEGVGTSAFDSSNSQNAAFFDGIGTTITEANYYIRPPSPGAWVKIHDSIVTNSDVATSYPTDTNTYTRGIDYEFDYPNGLFRALVGGSMVQNGAYNIDDIYTNSGPTWTSSNQCISGNCLYFDGVDDSLKSTSNKKFYIGPGVKFTFQTWIKSVNSTQPDNMGSAGLISHNYGNPLLRILSNRTINLYLPFDDLGRSLSTGSTIPENTWALVSATWDGSYIKIYINNKLEATSANFSSYNVTSRNDYIYLARDQAGVSKGMLKGYLDEPKIYLYARSATQIKQDYTSGLAGQSSAQGGNVNIGDIGTTGVALTIGSSSQTIGGTTTSLDYCLPGDTSPCSPPIAEYKFDEGIGTTAYDTSGNNNFGVFKGTTIPTWTIGKIGKALNFNGINSYIDAGTSPSLDITDEMTIEFWTKPTTQTRDYARPISRGGWLKSGWTIYTGTTAISTLSPYFSTDTSWSGLFAPVIAYQSNQWNHVAVVVKLGTYGKSYLNGINIGTTVVPATYYSSTAPFTIGTEGGSYYKGTIDQVKIYNYARTPAQIAYDYNKGGPVGWWKFDECQGGTVYNSAADPATAGLGSTGTITIGASGTQNSLGTCQVGTSAAWASGATGKINSSLNFDGVDDYINIGSTSITIGNDFSVSTWVKTSSSLQRPIVSNRSTGRMYFGISGGKAFLYYNSSSPANISSIAAINNSNWHHLLFVRSGTSSTLYVDGKLDNSITQTGYVATSSPISIGYDQANSEYFPGQIDDVRIYNYALTSTQIKTLYNGGAVNFR